MNRYSHLEKSPRLYQLVSSWTRYANAQVSRWAAAASARVRRPGRGPDLVASRGRGMS